MSNSEKPKGKVVKVGEIHFAVRPITSNLVSSQSGINLSSKGVTGSATRITEAKQPKEK